MRRSTIAGLGLALGMILSGCNGEDSKGLIVFAAASLTDAFQEIELEYEANFPAEKITMNFASSSALQAQIENGARASLFASANIRHMDALVEEGLVEGASVAGFAKNILGFVVPLENAAGIKDAQDLANDNIRIVIALPEVPAGAYALEAIHLLDEEFGGNFEERVIANVVSYEDSVRQVLLKVELGEADLGLVYQSDGQASEKTIFSALPSFAQPDIHYVIGIIEEAPNQDEAKQFLDFLSSSEGKSILTSWGFNSP